MAPTCSHGIWRAAYSTKWSAISLHFCHQPREPFCWPPHKGEQGECSTKNYMENRWLNSMGWSELFSFSSKSYNPPNALGPSVSAPGTFQEPPCLLLGRGEHPPAFLWRALSSWEGLCLPQITTCDGIWQPPGSIKGARKHLAATRPLGHFCPVLQVEISSLDRRSWIQQNI